MTELRIELHPSLPCHRCGGELLFAVRVPTQVTWTGGRKVTGSRTATLCPRCHRRDPAAQGLLAFLALHERITQDTVREAGTLIHEWIEHVTANPPPTYTNDDLAEDIRRWETGDM